MTPRGIRNNNPLNLRSLPTSYYAGQTGIDQAGFAIFATPGAGIAQACRQLLINASKHGLTTIRGQVSRWAPPNENDTAAYVAAVSKACGIGPDTPIDVTDASMLRALVLAIIQHENGQQPYPESVIDVAVAAALGMRAVDVPAHLPNEATAVAQTERGTPTKAATSSTPSQPSSSPPMPAILMALLPSILGLFAPRAQAALQKVTQQPPDVVEPFVQSLFQKLSDLTGKPDPVQATAAITAADVDAAKQQAVVDALQEHALDYLDKLGPTLDRLEASDVARFTAEAGDRDAASKRGLDMQKAGPAYDNPTFIVSLLVLLMIAAVSASVVFMPIWTADNRTQLLQSFLMALSGILGYWIGSTRGSSAKDVLIGQMAQKAQQ